MGRILLQIFNLNLHRASLHFFFFFPQHYAINWIVLLDLFIPDAHPGYIQAQFYWYEQITPVWSVYLQWYKPKVCKKKITCFLGIFSATSYHCKINEMQSYCLKIKGNYKERGWHRPYRSHPDLKADDGLCADRTMYHETSHTPNCMLQCAWGENSAACLSGNPNLPSPSHTHLPPQDVQKEIIETNDIHLEYLFSKYLETDITQLVSLGMELEDKLPGVISVHFYKASCYSDH